MPVISVFPDVQRAYNRVEVNWADTPSVEHARVLRVDVETGTCTPLRPYICYDGDHLLLSCGHGIFWDTEVPLDRSVYYITEGLDAPCIPAGPFVLDTFTRVLTDSWGVTDTGQAYTLSGGTVPGDYDVTGTMGTHTMGSVNTRRHSFLTSTQTDQNIYVDASLPVANATGAGITQWLLGRLTDVNNWYTARLELGTTGTVTLTLAKRVAGVVTDLTSAVTVGTGHAANDLWRIRLNIVGSQIQAKAWLISDDEPSAWQLTDTDTDLPAGTGIGVATRLEAGSGNTGLISSWDNLIMDEPCEPCVPVTADTSATPTTMPSNGAFRLRDPVRPCNDIYLPLCFDQANLAQVDGQFCIPGSGVFFASMESESYDTNALLLNPTNAKYPISVSRTRRGVSSNLTVVTRTFADRDAVLRINEAGSPLLLQGPPQYGIPDRYMAVQTVSVDRGLTDHKRQPRVITMPHVEVARPAGPTQGVCGSQVADMCDIYSTWDEMAAAGLTWDDLIRGRAGAETAPEFIDYRTWDEVEVEFADWNAVDDGTRTWHDLEVGD